MQEDAISNLNTIWTNNCSRTNLHKERERKIVAKVAKKSEKNLLKKNGGRIGFIDRNTTKDKMDLKQGALKSKEEKSC